MRGVAMPTLQISPVQSSSITRARTRAQGKFIFAGEEKLYVRGVTYGTFRPASDGGQYREAEIVQRDLSQMAANGFNAIRTYTVPPRWLLDLAEQHGLRVMVGLPWAQHIAFLDNELLARDAEERVRAGVRACAGHPAVLCYTIGNEIPASIVRWHGRRRVERFLRRLYEVAKGEDPEGLATYVNYPTTEYLELPFLDLVAFNVYLESPERLEAYLARLQNLAGERPLLMAEIGLDSRRNGEDGQARSLAWQVRTAFSSGCCGTFVFAWTDEWHRGGLDIQDWEFGLTTRERRPKPALAAVRGALSELPFPSDLPWPRISVVVCTFNGARTLDDCLQGLFELEYPDYEVIVVDDGSRDASATIASRYPCRLYRTENRGLSSARNTGLEAATGEIVAYIDDDARPDPHWLMYLAARFLDSEHVGVGGPNIAPPGDGPIAECVANAPGGPVHVLLTDEEAEHIPGCNMAFRKARLEAVGGFDPRFRAAGDDVDICWRLRERGWTLGFSPGAVVWHHRRNSVRAYWKQQQGYGKAEALLESKWPEKYNALGHLGWPGRLYGNGLTLPLRFRPGRVYRGVWGSAPFQSLYQPAPGVLSSLPLMPEWYLLILALAGVSALGVLWPPLLLALPLLLLAVAAPVIQALLSAARASFLSAPRPFLLRLGMRALAALLHLLQPLARLLSRLRNDLTPWRLRGENVLSWPLPRTHAAWTETWREPDDRLRALEADLKDRKVPVLRGGEYDGWDLEVRGGALGYVRLLSAVEEHGSGRQLMRYRNWPRYSVGGIVLIGILVALSIVAALDGALAASAVLDTAAGLVLLRGSLECSRAAGALRGAIRRVEGESR